MKKRYICCHATFIGCIFMEIIMILICVPMMIFGLINNIIPLFVASLICWLIVEPMFVYLQIIDFSYIDFYDDRIKIHGKFNKKINYEMKYEEMKPYLDRFPRSQLNIVFGKDKDGVLIKMEYSKKRLKFIEETLNLQVDYNGWKKRR